MATDRVVLVTGATGAVGPALVQALVRRGDRVRTLTRTPPPPGLLPAGIDAHTGNVADPGAVARAMDEVGCVFHLAAQLHITNPGPELRAQYTGVNVEGTRHLLAAAMAAGVGRVVHFSTINVYGPGTRGVIFDEDSPLRPDSWYAETKARAEELALGGGNATVLRLAAVYGPGMKGNYLRLLRALERGRFLMLGAGENRRTLVHVRDVAAAALLAADDPGAIGRIYNVTDGQIHPLRAIIAAMARGVGRRPPAFHLPVAPVSLAAMLIERSARLAGRRTPLERATLAKWLEDIAVRGQRLQDELGFRPAVDLVTGWRETAEALRVASRG